MVTSAGKLMCTKQPLHSQNIHTCRLTISANTSLIDRRVHSGFVTMATVITHMMLEHNFNWDRGQCIGQWSHLELNIVLDNRELPDTCSVQIVILQRYIYSQMERGGKKRA